eukprot:CAMPEP_0118856074 /NCGR_PEP_ID=MMETSP1163-20130328/3688_1 /TAXON_ID=124430 /ORGANISM="Phaeomonas parva, Strain CCMP2877" /LENGTH=48 /DNA_ID= /DNA_START= /DNA_END= /DNA_ORIENTATION=
MAKFSFQGAGPFGSCAARLLHKPASSPHGRSTPQGKRGGQATAKGARA